MKQSRISSEYAHDERHFSFPRTSGLPRDYFAEPRNVDGIVAVVVLALGAVTVALMLLGIIP